MAAKKRKGQGDSRPVRMLTAMASASWSYAANSIQILPSNMADGLVEAGKARELSEPEIAAFELDVEEKARAEEIVKKREIEKAEMEARQQAEKEQAEAESAAPEAEEGDEPSDDETRETEE